MKVFVYSATIANLDRCQNEAPCSNELNPITDDIQVQQA